MSYSWNKPLVNLPEIITTIWSCDKQDCNGWIRDNFSFKKQPICPLCKASMVSSEKVLPILIASDQEMKQYRKKQRAETIS